MTTEPTGKGMDGLRNTGNCKTVVGQMLRKGRYDGFKE